MIIDTSQQDVYLMTPYQVWSPSEWVGITIDVLGPVAQVKFISTPRRVKILPEETEEDA